MSCGCQATQNNCIREPFNANFVRPLEYVRGVDDNGCVSYTPVTSFAINVQDTNTLDLTFANGIISGDVRISGAAGNQIQVLADGLFVGTSLINVQDTPTVDLTLTATNDLSADVNVSSQPGNAIQVLSDGLFVSSINVQDTPTIDLTLTPTNDLSADVNVSAQAGNAVQVLPDGLFVAQLNVQDTPTVDLTLTATNDLSADVNVSAQPGNAIQVLPDGLFVGSTSINVQDTPTVDLTLTPTNDLIANVNVSAQTGNGLQVLADGLYIPSTSNPCLSNPPDLVNFPTNNLLVTYNANTGCLEQIAVPSERVVYGEPSGTGSPRADNLLYSPSNNFLRATVGPDFPMQNSFMLYGQNSNASGLFRSVIGAISNANIINSNLSFINVDLSYASFIRSAHSVVVGQNLTSNDLDVDRSVVLFRDSSISRVSNAFVNAWYASIEFAGYSFLCATSSSLPHHVNKSLCIAFSSDLPIVNRSSFIADSARHNRAAPTLINYCHANVAGVNFETNSVWFSTLHLSFCTLLNTGPDSGSYYSFIACSLTDLKDIRNSVFISRNFVNPNNQTPESYESFVTIRKENDNRIGPGSPLIRSSLIITSTTLPDSFNSLLISHSANPWFGLENSVCVGSGLQVNDLNPPYNTANLRNSLIVGQFHDVSATPFVESLLLVGSNLSAGTQTVFGVGRNAYAPPAVINAGGWRAYIADGGADNANYFQGWASAWRFRMFNPSINYANDAAAVAALNTAYGADPRNAVGTMVVALVAGNPAIFTWNGTTFVRITV